MTFYLFVAVFSFLGIVFGLPTGQNSTSFVHPNARTHGTIDGKIIGGQEAVPHAHPYQVGLYCHKLTVTNFCGGSLISKNFVLTAAHCAEDVLTMDLIFGAHRIEDFEDTQVRQTSSEFIIHPGWDEGQLINDIALVKLVIPVEETDYIKIIRLVSNDDTFAGQQGIITGWGRTTNAQQGVTPVLMYALGDILSNDQCRSIDPYQSVIQSTHLCLLGLSSSVNVGTCNGDSGGPLTVGGVQVGIVSFGYNDCEAGKPSVFTRLTEFRSWVVQNSDVEF